MSEVLTRLKVQKILELDQLIILLAQILSSLKNRTLTSNLRLIVIDSLSSLFSGIDMKRSNQYYFCLVKEQEILPYKSDEHVQGEEESMVERYFEHLSQQMQ